ncbi:EF-Hand 1, calcium-binding site [Phytophthora cactorum]|nr:EF-Hand 1, calcium-binding site [Phytophthora cactorum]
MVTKVTPVTDTRLPSLTGASQLSPTTDDATAHYSSAASTKRRLSGSSKKRPRVGEEYMRRLRALFHACDADEDTAILPNELLILLELMGATAAEARAFGVTASGRRDEAITYDAFVEMNRDLIVRCAQERRPLPPTSFVARCKALRNAYNRCDTDGSHEISPTELEIALQKLGLVFSDEELDAIRRGRIHWATREPAILKLHKYFSVDLFTELPSFIRASADRQQRPTHKRPRRGSETPDSDDTTDEAGKSYLSRMERIGVEFLTRVSKERVQRAKRATLVVSLSARFGAWARSSQTQSVDQHQAGASVLPIQTLAVSTKRGANVRSGLHQESKQSIISERRYGFSVEIMRQLRNIEWAGTLLGFLIGLVCGLLSMGLESLLPSRLVVDEVWGFNGYVLLINIAVSLLEVIALYTMAVTCAFRLTIGAGLILYPLDREREFLARAVARAALQVGHRKDTLFGMDPMRGSPRLVLLMTYLMYKGKRYVVKFLLKLFIKRVLWRATARSALNATVLPIQGLLNAWTIRRVLRNCRINIVGPPCAIEALESFLLEDACFKPAERVDYMRVMGCCLVCKRMVHPNVEIMVEHLRHRWINADSWPIGDDGCTCLQSPPIGVRPTGNVSLPSGLGVIVAAAISVPPAQSLLPANRGAGDRRLLGLGERRFYVRVCEAAGVQNHWSSVLKLKEAFVQGRGLDVEAIFSLVQLETNVEMHCGTEESSSVPWRESLSYLGSRMVRLLSC